MREIDRLEDELSPLPENITRVRKLISTLECCHHKAERWVTNIIEAIGEGDTSKGLLYGAFSLVCRTTGRFRRHQDRGPISKQSVEQARSALGSQGVAGAADD
jgi:hypothetical protein